MNRRSTLKSRSRLLPALAACAALLAAAACPGLADAPAPTPGPSSVPLIPLPSSVEPRPGVFTLRSDTPIRAAPGDTAGHDAAAFLKQTLAQTGGPQLQLQTGDGGAEPAITLLSDPQAAGAGAEDYSLDVSPQGIRISAREPAGLFYGAVTLWQLLTPAPGGAATRQIPALHIEDHPRFAWRGLMLDVARHYMPPQFIEQLIDWMALHKLNTLHWHLTDDQGWRLEIKKYPRLTSVGAWRNEPDGTRSGGYYTQDQVRALVRYAAARHITIVPEIDLPGHAQAAVAAYPWLGSRGDHPAVSHDWGVNPYLFNVDERTFGFVGEVLAEVLELFPSQYIHVGGDEAIKTQWRASKKVQARMRALGLKDEDALQGWFMQRLETWLAAHGRKLVGWDEIVDAGLPPDATVMSWRGIEGGIAAARAGHDVVMSPSTSLYFDYLQGAGHDEPPGRPQLITLADVYAFDPLPKQLDAQQARHIIGMQANVWTEHIATPALVEHAVFPRLAALAETAWSPATAHDWPGFLRRLLPMLDRYRALGIAYAGSAFSVQVAALPGGPGAATLSLSTQSGEGEIRYTLDGADPGPSSPRYQAPLQLKLPVELRAAPFVDGQAIAAVTLRQLDAASLLSRDSDGLGGCSDKLPLRLTGPAHADGAPGVYRVDIIDPCWTWAAAPLDGVKRIQVRIARLPYNFQLGLDNDKIVLRPPHRAGGELEVHRERCDGPLLAALPLPPDTAVAGPQTLEADLAAPDGTHDLCLFFTRKSPDPLWAIDTVRLVTP
ncbi:MAG TPA: family 20 glycosylhydrolase [Nevskia sp.]|nr:family 20 glycosylhydrolase [Nevskia sp.]